MQRKLPFLVSLFFTINALQAQGFLHADGTKIVNGKGEEVILRGVGLGGWMLQEPYMLKLSGIAYAQHDIRSKIASLIGPKRTGKFYQTWLKNHCTEKDINFLAALGMNSVRLPMHYNLFTLPTEKEPKAGMHTWLDKGFELTDQLLQWCKANRVYLILDLHAAPGGNGSDNPISDRDTSKPNLWQSQANQDKTVALWQKLAARYAHEPWIGGYDLINEPNWGFSEGAEPNGCNEESNSPLRELQMRITSAIREVDSNHIIFIEGNCWGNNYAGMFPPWDNNLVISFHKYWNHNTQESIQKYLDLRDRYQVPIWLGETGENSNAWYTDLVKLAEKNGIGWNMWPLKKSGINNILEVPMPATLQPIYNYWSGKGPRPARKKAFQALMQFAAHTHFSENILRLDVMDAILRQGGSSEPKAFKEHTAKAGEWICAVNYDLGAPGISYNDTETYEYWVSTGVRTGWNRGGHYRNDGVDIEKCSDDRGIGYNVAYTEDGEWIEYTVNSPENARYHLEIRTASPKEGGQLQLLVNGKVAGETLHVPNSGGYQQWTSSELRNIAFGKGINRLRIIIKKGGFNFNAIRFHSVTDTESVEAIP